MAQWHRDLGPNNKFTMHGLWPNDCDGSHDNSTWCDRERKYNNVEDILHDYPDKRDGFLDDMYKYWPSFMPTPQNPDFNKFWSREWGKHGTCLSTLDPGCMSKEKAVYSYFNKALTLREEYDIYAALAAHNITPGDSYPVDEVIDAIEQELGVGAAVVCKHGPTDPLEVRWISYSSIHDSRRCELGEVLTSKYSVYQKFRLFFQVQNKDQYKPVMRPDNTDKEQFCVNSMVYYQRKRTESNENWPTHL
ncbi:ribonuclease T2-like [Mortierella alpina]|nr:ribonuclease T2-like [Mortierella alpina]